MTHTSISSFIGATFVLLGLALFCLSLINSGHGSDTVQTKWFRILLVSVLMIGSGLLTLEAELIYRLVLLVRAFLTSHN